MATTDTYSLLNTLSELPDTFHKKNPIIKKKMYQHLGRTHTHTHRVIFNGCTQQYTVHAPFEDRCLSKLHREI